MATLNSNTIVQGDTFTLSVAPLDADGVAYDLSVGTWNCTIGVYDADSIEQVRVTSNTLNPDGTFNIYLTPAQTSVLAAKTYTLAIQVDRSDVTPALSMEYHEELIVSPQLIT